MKSNKVSLYLRKIIERSWFREIIGINLAGFTFFAAVILPQTHDLASTTEVFFTTTDTTISIPQTKTLQWPLKTVSISQRFSYGHPGMDLPAPLGTPIYPIADGVVVWTISLPWGYGNHVLVAHNSHITALYAHMSKVEVKAGDAVHQAKEIGQIGSTGWSSGNHLHMEIYQDNVPINPLEVLPNLTTASL